MKKNFQLILLFFILLINNSINAQTEPANSKLPDAINFNPGYSTSGLIQVNSGSDDLSEMIDVIVEFNEEPLFIQQQAGGLAKGSLGSYQAIQKKFANDLSKLFTASKSAYLNEPGTPLIKKEFYKIFNGVSIKIPRQMLSAIASLDYVKKVHPDKIERISIRESVSLIGADSVWIKYGNKGDSSVVAILDTGIDYFHPALGGGFGKGFKVIGGYDFVNKDKDPRDDHGHGTHVSGIVAADGDTVKGVAPKAFLMAMKVIGADGNGWESDIISGIEMSVDPNGDNNYDDMVDVINLSVGGSGSPDDAGCTAVNNAVRIGVVCCCAAGNNALYNTVDSPGMAELAITVGATDKSDKMGYLSSKGPNRKNYFIKPEIVAPGIGIKSTYLNNGFVTEDGTSQATPHVAGVCALLKHAHKDWTPAYIKSAVMTSSKDLGFDVMAQGAGRVDALNSMTVTSVCIPTQLNFGMDKGSVSLWEKKDSTVIINKSSISQFYNINFTGIVSGINLVANPSSFTLSPGASQKVVYSISVDNNTIPYVYKNSLSYGGMVNISGTKDKLHLPWAFVKTSILIMNFNKPVQNYMLFLNKTKYRLSDAVNSSDFYTSEILLPQGKYNMLFTFTTVKDSAAGSGEMDFIIKENYDVSGYQTLDINSTEAVNKINFAGKDESSRILSSLSNCENSLSLVYSDSASATTFTVFNGSLSPKFSIFSTGFSSKFLLVSAQFQNSTLDENKFRLVQFPLIKGLSGNVDLVNKSQEFLKQNVNITLSPDKKLKKTAFCKAYCSVVNNALNISKLYPEKGFLNQNQWSGSLLINPSNEKDYYYTTFITGDIPTTQAWFETDIFRTSGDSISCFSASAPAFDLFVSPNNGTLNFGNGAVFPNSNFWSILTSSGFQINCSTNMQGQLNEVRYADNQNNQYQLLDDQDTQIISGTVTNLQPFNVKSGKYKFIIKNNNYLVDGFPGLGTLTAGFDLSVRRTVPAAITSLKILNAKGFPVSRFKKGEKGKITFTTVSENFYWNINLDSTKIFLRKNGGKEWKELVITDTLLDLAKGVFLKADIGEFTNYDSSKIDLKIVVMNNHKNKTEWVLEPAFLVGDNITGIESDITAGKNTPAVYVLHNNYPNPFNPVTNISYDLPGKSNVELKVFDLLGREVKTLVNGSQEPGSYSIQFDASGLSSGLYLYRIKTNGFVATKKMVLIK